MKHHTKDKGDIGLANVIASLVTNGIQVATLLSEHQAFDCIAISAHGELKRLSVKYRTISNTGRVEIKKSSTWADRNGTHIRKHSESDYDAVAVFATDNKCYYFLPEEMLTTRLKLEPKHLDPNRIFTPPLMDSVVSSKD